MGNGRIMRIIGVWNVTTELLYLWKFPVKKKTTGFLFYLCMHHCHQLHDFLTPKNRIFYSLINHNSAHLCATTLPGFSFINFDHKIRNLHPASSYRKPPLKSQRTCHRIIQKMRRKNILRGTRRDQPDNSANLTLFAAVWLLLCVRCRGLGLLSRGFTSRYVFFGRRKTIIDLVWTQNHSRLLCCVKRKQKGAKFHFLYWKNTWDILKKDTRL